MSQPTDYPDRSYFFDQGLQFSCTGCGQCCTGAPGTIHVGDKEIDRLAERLAMSRAAFLRRYTYRYASGRSLKEYSNGDCIFLEGGRCTVYEDRPAQCRTYPFWPENVRSEAAWKRTAKACPGVGQGKVFDKQEILAKMQEALDAYDSM